MPSFGEGFINALNSTRAINVQRDASARAFVTAEQDRAQKLQLEQQKAQREKFKFLIGRIDEEMNSALEIIKGLDKQDAVAFAEKMEPSFTFGENLSQISGLGGTNHRARLMNAANARPTREQRLTKLREEALAKDVVNVEMIGPDPNDPRKKIRITVPRSQELAMSRAGFVQFDAASAGAPKSDLFDERGALKTETTGEIRRQMLIGINARRDPLGNALELTPQQQKDFPKLMARAEERLRKGLSDGIADAVEDTLAEMPPKINETTRERAERLINVINSKAKEGGKPANIGEMQQDEARIKLRLEDASGVLSGLKEAFFNRFASQFLSDTANPGVVRARQSMGLLVNDWIIANKRSPGRIPVFEQMRLNRIFQEPSIWRSPEQVRFQLLEWRERLTRAIDEELIIMEGRQSPKEAQESIQAVRSMARVRAAINRFDVDTQTQGFFDFNRNIPEQPEPSISLEGIRRRR